MTFLWNPKYIEREKKKQVVIYVSYTHTDGRMDGRTASSMMMIVKEENSHIPPLYYVLYECHIDFYDVFWCVFFSRGP